MHLNKQVYATQQFASRVVFNVTGRPIIPIKIKGSSTWTDTTAILDSGNDITLISFSLARQMGIDYEKEGSPFMVSGVGGQPTKYYLVRKLVQLGNLQPRVFRIGIGNPPVNLLGREDISAYYRVVFDAGRIIIEELSVKAANVTTASGIGFRQQKFFHGDA